MREGDVRRNGFDGGRLKVKGRSVFYFSYGLRISFGLFLLCNSRCHLNPLESVKVQPIWVPIDGIEMNADLPTHDRAFTKFLLAESEVMNARVEWYAHGEDPTWSILNAR